MEVPNGRSAAKPRYPAETLAFETRIARQSGGRPGWYLDRRAGRPYLNSERPGPGQLGSAKPRELLTLFAVGSKKLIRAAGAYCRLASESMQAKSMKVSPFKFLQEVRAEAQKVTWPSRRETAITTAMVFVMVAIASVFFLVADQFMRMFVTLILGIGG